MTIARKFLSRKFLVFLVGTVGLFTGHLPPEHWVVLSGVYMGIEGVIDYKGPIGSSNASPKPTR